MSRGVIDHIQVEVKIKEELTSIDHWLYQGWACQNDNDLKPKYWCELDGYGCCGH